jgi:hypothetical protein
MTATETSSWPSPVGLCLGILSVAVGQVVVLTFHYLRVKFKFFGCRPVQGEAVKYQFWEGVATHLKQPEGFFVLASYLSLTWMFNLMPSSYYSFEGGINWIHVLQQLLLQVFHPLLVSLSFFLSLFLPAVSFLRI